MRNTVLKVGLPRIPWGRSPGTVRVLLGFLDEKRSIHNICSIPEDLRKINNIEPLRLSDLSSVQAATRCCYDKFTRVTVTEGASVVE